MDANHVEVAINYPNTFPRFAGQGFAERADKDLALRVPPDLQRLDDRRVVRRRRPKGRLIPLTLVPLWDPALAADEVRRCAAKGSYAIAFSENPSKLGFASLYSGEWDVLWDACTGDRHDRVDAHRLVVDDAGDQPRRAARPPRWPSARRTPQGSLCDWVFSGTLSRFPTLKIAFAESQIGWMPYLLERMDIVAARGRGRRRAARPARRARSCRGRVWGCVFDDQHGLRQPRRGRARAHPLRDRLPPHRRHLARVARRRPPPVRGRRAWTQQECYAFLRGNAIRCYGLERFGITA